MRSIIIKNLPIDVTEEALRQAFSPAGTIERVVIEQEFAKIKFSSCQEARKAADELNGVVIEGIACSVQLKSHHCHCHHQKKWGTFVTVKNLPSTFDQRDLSEVMRPFGPIVSVRVELNEQGNSLGFGRVEYLNKESAEQAIQVANGMVLTDKEGKTHAIQVELFSFRKAFRHHHHHHHGHIHHEEQDATRIKVFNMPELTEQCLANLFSQFGTIEKCKIRECRFRTGQKVGIIRFTDTESAKKAVDAMNGASVTDINGQTTVIEVGLKQHHWKRHGHNHSSCSSEEDQGQRILFRNLPPSYTKESLQDLLSACEALEVVKVKDSRFVPNTRVGIVGCKDQEMMSSIIEQFNGIQITDAHGAASKLEVLLWGDHRRFGRRHGRFHGHHCNYRLETLATTVIIGNLNPATSKETVKHLFDPFGVMQCFEVNPSPFRPGRNFAKIVYETSEAADNAILAMDGYTLDSQVIKVSSPQDCQRGHRGCKGKRGEHERRRGGRHGRGGRYGRGRGRHSRQDEASESTE
ncbi:hypothetical protein RCL1_008648 [Eukaryota sp. TZLM3-RCL]